MTPLEIIALIVAALTVIDAVIAILKPKGLFRRISDAMNSGGRWKVPALLLIIAIIFSYFILQYQTVIQIVPGLFLGVLLTKAMTAQHPKGTMVIAKEIYTKTDWLAVIVDLVVVAAILLSLFILH